MAQYVKKEMADLRGTGSTGAYYRLKTWRKLELYASIWLTSWGTVTV